MSKRRTVFELGRSCEITGLEHVASHHLLSTEILTVPGHCDAMRCEAVRQDAKGVLSRIRFLSI